MVLPTSTDDVVKIAEIITTYQCPFGLRSGAHSAFNGSNGVENGVTVDFGKAIYYGVFGARMTR